MSSYTESQKRYLRVFESHVDIKSGEIFDKEFEEDILRLRTLGDNMLKRTEQYGNRWDSYTPFFRFTLKHKIPRSLHRFLYLFIQTGEIKPALIKPMVSLISEAHGKKYGDGDDPEASYEYYAERREKELKLTIGADVSIKQIKQFLDNHRHEIETMQEGYRKLDAPKISRPYINAKRDYKIVELHRQGFSDGEIAKQISKEYASISYKKVWEIRKNLEKPPIPV